MGRVSWWEAIDDELFKRLSAALMQLAHFALLAIFDQVSDAIVVLVLKERTVSLTVLFAPSVIRNLM